MRDNFAIDLSGNDLTDGGSDQPPLISNRFLVHLDRLIIERGGQPAKFVRDAGLPYATLSGKDIMIPFAGKARLLLDVERQLNLPPIGLELAARQFIAHFSSMFPVLSHQFNIHESLLAFNDNLPSLIENVSTQLEVRDKLAYFSLSSDIALIDDDAGFQDHAVGVMAHLLWWLSAGEIKLTKVLLPHQGSQYQIRYHAFFGCQVVFDSDQLSVCFDEKYLRSSIATSAKFAKKEYSQTMEWNRKADLPMRLREVIRELISDDKIDLERASDQVGMTSRTLQRRLHELGTSFHWQLDSVRAGLSRRMLCNPDYSIARISQILGYANQAAFSRSFSRWYGATPSHWRKVSKQDT